MAIHAGIPMKAEMLGNIPERIRSSYDALTPSERRIADVLFDSDLMVGLENVATLAERARVSGPTVIRFATKLGFEGFPQLQSALRGDLRARLASPLDHYAQAKRHGDAAVSASAAARVFNEGVSKSLARLRPSVLKEVCELVLNPSRRVHLVGGRFTQHIAAMLWGHLHQLRPDTHMMRPGVVSLQESALDFGKGDILIVFDIRRYQSDIIELARAARSRGATLILVTDPLLSPIAKWAKHILICDLDSPSPHHSLVPCLALVESFIAELNIMAGEPGRERIARLEGLRGEHPVDPGAGEGRTRAGNKKSKR